MVDQAFISEHTTTERLADGGQVRLRPIVPDDKERLIAGLRRMSPHSRYLRFLADLNDLTDEQLRYLTEVDYDDHFAWVAEDPETGEGVGVARYVRLPDEPTEAEAAVAVIDDYQGRGIGRLLLRRLAETAREHGIDRFRGYISAENVKLLEALDRRDAELVDDGEVVRVEIPLEPADTLLRRLFSSVASGRLSFLYPFVRRLKPKE